MVWLRPAVFDEPNPGITAENAPEAPPAASTIRSSGLSMGVAPAFLVAGLDPAVEPSGALEIGDPAARVTDDELLHLRFAPAVGLEGLDMLAGENHNRGSGLVSCDIPPRLDDPADGGIMQDARPDPISQVLTPLGTAPNSCVVVDPRCVA